MEESMNGNYVKYGVIGICMALISLISFMYYKTCEKDEMLMKLMENHFAHNTAVMEQLKASTENNTKATTENTQVLRDLRIYITK